jgi:hypothetical protein
LTVAPVTDPHLPALALAIALAPDPVAIGDTLALTLTVANGAADPAEDLVVSLPRPDGALPLSGPITRTPLDGWLWDVGRLEAQSSIALTATLRLVRMPAGQALLLRPQATARGLADPLVTEGGALVVDPTLGPATARFSPGAPITLRRGRVQLDFPAGGFDRPLTLRAAATPRLGAPPSARAPVAAPSSCSTSTPPTTVAPPSTSSISR